jgi:MYXO-CTERM domain-containing protein
MAVAVQVGHDLLWAVWLLILTVLVLLRRRGTPT